MAHRGWLRLPPLDKCTVERIRLVEHGEMASVVEQDDVGIGQKLAEPHPSALPGLKGIVASPQEEGRRLNTSQSWCDCGRSEEHTSELQSQSNLVCRLL